MSTPQPKKPVIERALEINEVCFISNGFIIFRIEDKEVYDVPLAQCDTYPKVIGWMLHLADKNWVTADLLGHFTLLACDYHGLEIEH